jgi:hypothetical protein
MAAHAPRRYVPARMGERARPRRDIARGGCAPTEALDFRHHLHARLPGGRVARLSAPTNRDAVPVGDIVTAGSCGASGITQAQRRRQNCCARCARERGRARSGQSRRVRAPVSGHEFGGIEVAQDWIHVTADGRRLWIGDLPTASSNAPGSPISIASTPTLRPNARVNSPREVGLLYWSLSQYLKHRVKRARLHRRLRAGACARGA